MSRNNPRGALIALAAASALGGCTDMYLDRRDTVSFAAGDITFPNDLQVAPASDDPYRHVAPARSPKTAAVFQEILRQTG